MKNVRIAIQGKGRLAEESAAFLKNLGLSFNPNGRNCSVTCLNADLDILFLRDDDIAEYVERGVADFGIVGENVLLEKRARVKKIKKLNFGNCSLALAVPKKSKYEKPEDLSGARIATSYPDLLNQFLLSRQISAEIITIKGSAEIAPSLNLADAICDLVQTGKTLEDNDLRKIETLMYSQAILIQTLYPSKRNREQINTLFSQQ